MDELIVYGSGWCPHTRDTRRLLDTWDVPYEYVDVDEHPMAERQIAEWNNGRAVRPTLDIGGDIYVNPEPEELAEALDEHGMNVSGASVP